MLILLIDTSSETARVALAEDEKILAQREWPNTPKVGIELLKALESVTRDANTPLTSIQRVAVHAGPGHYSATRTGVITASFLAMALEAELVEVTSHDPQEAINQAGRADPVKHIQPQYEGKGY